MISVEFLSSRVNERAESSRMLCYIFQSFIAISLTCNLTVTFWQLVFLSRFERFNLVFLETVNSFFFHTHISLTYIIFN